MQGSLVTRMKDMTAQERHENLSAIIQEVAELVVCTRSWVPALGALIHIRNRPFTEGMFPQFESIFRLDLTPNSILKCGRQVGKSANSVCKTLVMSASIPFFQTLTVTPLFEMTRRYSSNYVRPLLEFSPLGEAMLNTSCERSVLQKTLSNQAMMHFSYASIDADRCRGIPADRVHIDEGQDIDPELVPEIKQVLGRSNWAITDITGTPKTIDNLMEVEWQKSTRAEWLIPCSCGYTNNPNVEADGLAMIGIKTLVCARCNKPLNADDGYWYHFNKDALTEHIGWHVPQHILPFHYDNKRNWAKIVAAKDGAIPKRTFFNEILGESCDVGAKLITESDLRAACMLPVKMEYNKAVKLSAGYTTKAIGVDWGGRGKDSMSFTKIAVIGMRPDGRCDLIYGENLANFPDGGAEVSRVIKLFYQFGCQILCHDTGGTAGMRDVFFAQSGFPMERVMPMAYVSAWTKETVVYHPPTEASSDRSYYSVDKTKSLMLMVMCLKNKFLFFPEYESCKTLLNDFMALIEEKSDARKGADVFLVRRAMNMSDDFAHAVNFASVGLYHKTSKWPALLDAVQLDYALTDEELAIFNPDPKLADWEDGVEGDALLIQ